MSITLHNSLKSDLRLILPRTIKTSHIDEAVACGLGFASYAAMPKSSEISCPLDFGWKASARLHALSSSQCWVNPEQMLEACCEVALHRRAGQEARVFPQSGALPLILASAVLLEALEFTQLHRIREGILSGSFHDGVFTVDEWPVIQNMTRYLKPGGLIMRKGEQASHHEQLMLPLGDRLDVQRNSDGYRISYIVPDAPLPMELLPSMSNIDKASYDCIVHAIRNRRRIVITGAYGSGRTELANMLLASISWQELVCTISAPREFKVPLGRPGLILWEGDIPEYDMPTLFSTPPKSWLVMAEVDGLSGSWAMRQATVSHGALLCVYPLDSKDTRPGNFAEKVLRRIRKWHPQVVGDFPVSVIDFIISIDGRSREQGMSISCWNVHGDWSLSKAC